MLNKVFTPIKRPKPHIKRIPGFTWGYYLSREARNPVLLSADLSALIYRVSTYPNRFNVYPNG